MCIRDRVMVYVYLVYDGSLYRERHVDDSGTLIIQKPIFRVVRVDGKPTQLVINFISISYDKTGPVVTTYPSADVFWIAIGVPNFESSEHYEFASPIYGA